MTEFVQGDLRLVLAPSAAQSETTSTSRAVGPTATKTTQYAALFNGRIPSFEQYRQSGLVTEES